MVAHQAVAPDIDRDDEEGWRAQRGRRGGGDGSKPPAPTGIGSRARGRRRDRCNGNGTAAAAPRSVEHSRGRRPHPAPRHTPRRPAPRLPMGPSRPGNRQDQHVQIGRGAAACATAGEGRTCVLGSGQAPGCAGAELGGQSPYTERGPGSPCFGRPPNRRLWPPCRPTLRQGAPIQK